MREKSHILVHKIQEMIKNSQKKPKLWENIS